MIISHRGVEEMIFSQRTSICRVFPVKNAYKRESFVKVKTRVIHAINQYIPITPYKKNTAGQPSIETTVILEGKKSSQPMNDLDMMIEFSYHLIPLHTIITLPLASIFFEIVILTPQPFTVHCFS